jgi:hypothetical protein
VGAGRFDLTRWLFLRLLAVVYAIAFASLGVQVTGLVGPEGILPAGDYLAVAGERLGDAAPWQLPTLWWLTGTSEAALLALCWGGVALAALLFVNVVPLLTCALLWATYLSLTVAGQVFLGFQWDALLLETGLVACLLAPAGIRPGVAPGTPRSAIWLLRLLLFKLSFLSGVVKLRSGDPAWWDLTALEYHYWTTCLPVWVGWYAQHLPAIAHRAAAAVMFSIELVVPFGIVGPRRVRRAAGALLVALQAGIAATGNYGFFNLLTVALCIPLLDDRMLGRASRPEHDDAGPERRRGGVGAVMRPTLAGALGILSLATMVPNVAGPEYLPAPLRDALAAIRPLRSVNAYGLFATMTKDRPEIVIEGSTDGRTWQAYEFRWKPGDPRRRPDFVQPHMPRLDWQMWFAALQGYERTYWFPALLDRLAEGRAPVLALLASNPFPDEPPRYLRARLFTYRFSSPDTRAATGAWWVRRDQGLYAPPRQRPSQRPS